MPTEDATWFGSLGQTLSAPVDHTKSADQRFETRNTAPSPIVAPRPPGEDELNPPPCRAEPQGLSSGYEQSHSPSDLSSLSSPGTGEGIPSSPPTLDRMDDSATPPGAPEGNPQSSPTFDRIDDPVTGGSRSNLHEGMIVSDEEITQQHKRKRTLSNAEKRVEPAPKQMKFNSGFATSRTSKRKRGIKRDNRKNSSNKGVLVGGGKDSPIEVDAWEEELSKPHHARCIPIVVDLTSDVCSPSHMPIVVCL